MATPNGEVKTDISTIPIATLEKDLQESRDDISICEIALLQGITTYKGGSVQERLDGNKHFVKVISAELDRRQKENDERTRFHI